MNEAEIETRFEEIRNELKSQKEQIDAFKEDLKILLKHRSIAPRDILDTAQQLEIQPSTSPMFTNAKSF